MPFVKGECLGILALLFEVSECEKDDLTDLIWLQTVSLLQRVVIELNDGLDSLEAADVVAIGVAGRSQVHPVLHYAWLQHQKLAGGVLETGEVAKMNLELVKLAKGPLVRGFDAQGRQISPSRLIVFPTKSRGQVQTC